RQASHFKLVFNTKYLTLKTTETIVTNQSKAPPFPKTLLTNVRLAVMLDMRVAQLAYAIYACARGERMQSGYLVQAYERHTWRVLFSLPACISTAMLLIDYVVHGAMTPTTWPATVSPRLSAQALNDLGAMHAILAHGSVLRGFFLEQMSSDMPEQRDWSALYDWLARLSDAEIERLVTYGIRSNLEYHRMYPQTPQTPEMGPLFEQLEADDSVLEDELYRSRAIRAILDSWGVQQHGPSLALI